MAQRRVTMIATAGLLVALLMCTTPAHSDSGLVVTTGSASERERAAVAEVFADVAVKAGWSISSKRLTAKEAMALASCKAATPAECLPASVAKSDVDRLLVVAVNATQVDGAPALELVARVLLARTSKMTDDKRYCERCTEAQLRDVSADLAATVLRRFATQSAQTLLAITSEPAGAQIVLDDGTDPIGVTPGTFQTYPGKHSVIAQKPGHISAQQEVTVKEGETVTVTLTLAPVSTTPPPLPAHADQPSRVGPVLVMGAGTAAIVAAVILYAYDEDDGPKVGSTYTDTAPGAIALGVCGAIAVGVGYVWWRKRSHAASAPTASLVPGGATVGWSGSF